MCALLWCVFVYVYGNVKPTLVISLRRQYHYHHQPKIAGDILNETLGKQFFISLASTCA